MASGEWRVESEVRKGWNFYLAWFLLALSLFTIQYALPYDEFWDDAFISILYARNLARGVGPVFLPFDRPVATPESRVEGYSNPLWTFLLAAFFRLPGSIFFWIKLASLISLLVLAFCSQGLFRELCGHDPTRWMGVFCWLPPLLVLLSLPAQLYVKSGLETVPQSALLLAGLWHSSVLLRRPSSRGALCNGLLWSASALIRPEGVLYAGLGFAALFAGQILSLISRSRSSSESSPLDRLIRGSRIASTWKPVVGWSLSFGIPFLAFLTWRLWFYGEWLPNTYYAKVSALHFLLGWTRWTLLSEGFRYFLQYIRTDLPWGVLFAGLMSPLFLFHFRTRVYFLIAAAIGLNVFYSIWVGGDFFPLSRFLLPTTLLLTLLATDTVFALFVSKTTWRPVLSGLLLLLVVVSQPALRPAVLARLHLETENPTGRLQELFGHDPQSTQLQMGIWLGQNLEPDTVIATGSCGQIPYYSQLETVDLQRLADHHLARNPITVEYLQQRSVEHLIFELDSQGQVGPGSSYHQLAEDPLFHRNFRPSKLFVGRSRLGGLTYFAMFSRRASEETAPEGSPVIPAPQLPARLAAEDVERIVLSPERTE